MNRLSKYLLLVAMVVLSGCAGLGDDAVHVSDSEKANPNAVKFKYLASVRIAGYVDGRTATTPRRIGKREARVVGISGPDIVLDRDVSDIVAASMRRRLDDLGIQILAKDDPAALFELSGVIKELKYDVKARDQILVKVETTLKEVATGKVVWSGEVEQKEERFAGVSGNNKSDIADYLKQQVGVVTGKTAEAINSVLMATRPELFNLTPGTKTIPGVKVFVTPGVAAPVAPGNPTTLVPNNTATLNPSVTDGQLSVRTEPGRAKVYLDGVYYGLSPLLINVTAGVHTVEVKLAGYKKATEKVALRPATTTELELQLEK